MACVADYRPRGGPTHPAEVRRSRDRRAAGNTRGRHARRRGPVVGAGDQDAVPAAGQRSRRAPPRDLHGQCAGRGGRAPQLVDRFAQRDRPGRRVSGNQEGSHTERLAAALAPLIADSDVVIDLHGGGTWCINAFVKRFAGSEQLAADLGAPFIREAPDKRGGLTTYARSLGIKVVNVEVGGRSSREMYWTERNVAGLKRALHNCGVLALDTPPAPADTAVDVGPTTPLRAKVGGIFVPTLREDAVGTIVPGGAEMGKILDLHTLAELQIFTAPFARTAMMLMRPQICTVEGSALVYVVAAPV